MPTFGSTGCYMGIAFPDQRDEPDVPDASLKSQPSTSTFDGLTVQGK